MATTSSSPQRRSAEVSRAETPCASGGTSTRCSNTRAVITCRGASRVRGRCRLRGAPDERPRPAGRPFAERARCEPSRAVLERAQQSVEHAAQQAGPEARRERPALGGRFVAHAQPAGVLEGLGGEASLLYRDHLRGDVQGPTSMTSRAATPRSPLTSTSGPLTRSTRPISARCS